MSIQQKQEIFMAELPIVLASQSLSRKKIFAQLGICFDVVPVDTEPEAQEGEDPFQYVMHAAEVKASTAASMRREALIVGADTVVVCHTDQGYKILGKPKSPQDAFRMLLEMQRGKCQVATGCCIIWPFEGTHDVFYDTADFCIGEWPEEVLFAYANTGEGMDKAGGVGIESTGGVFIESIGGNFMTVMGLPLPRLVKTLLAGGAIKPAMQHK